MLLAALPFALSLAAAATPAAPTAQPAHVVVSSTYDEATCAGLRGELTPEGMDGWDRAAIGENIPLALVDDDCPVAAVPVGRASACADPENDPLVRRQLSQLFGEKIDTCYVPRMSGTRNAVKAARPDEQRRAQRILGQPSDCDAAAPLAPRAEPRDPLVAITIALDALPSPVVGEEALPTLPLRIPPAPSYEPQVPPPRA